MRPANHFTVVTLPAYKAEGTLERTVGALPAGTADHLLLVDDASPDATVDVARRLGSMSGSTIATAATAPTRRPAIERRSSSAPP